MEQTEAKEIYQMGVEALNDCDYRMAGAYFQNAAKMNYKPAIAALEKLILEGKYKNVQSKQTLSSNTESKELFEKGVDYYRGRNNTKIDYVKAFECFLSSSIDGYAPAMNWLGYCYEYGKGTKKNLDSAFGWYEKAANANIANAIYHLGRLYYDGKGVQQDYNKAFGLFKKACDLRESLAYEYLADCYFYGQGTKINYEKALQFYLKVKPRGVIEYQIGCIYARGLSTGSDYPKAAEHFQKGVDFGHAHSMNNLGALYYNGEGVQKDYNKAFELFKKASDLGNTTAHGWLADCYYYGNGAKKDYQKALQLYLKAKSSRHNEGQIGYIYEHGLGTPIDINKAIEHYQKGVDLGCTGCMHNLGTLYYKGEGCQKDYNKAFELFKKASDLGYTTAHGWLADCCFYGYGTQKDYQKALQLYLKAESNGHNEAQIGWIYRDGLGTSVDINKAIEHFQKGVDFGNTNSMISLGILYYEGKGIQQDYYKAFELFKKASDLENKTAYAWLAECYYYGNGAKKDYQKALQLYLKGNLYGYTQSQIGRIYESGQDVKKNLTEALNWYKKANESGEDCKADIERINNLLNKKPENKSIDKTKVETKANSNKPIKAYEGDKPYIFVSYSHTDSKVVKEVLQMLINQGYRIWFDEGIRAGSSWTENLMNHIKNASHFIFFLSRHSINSKYCLKELRFADRRNKIIIPICIENVNVSDEIDFLLGEVQMLFKNNLEKEEFMEKFNSSNHIEICSR